MYYQNRYKYDLKREVYMYEYYARLCVLYKYTF